MNVHLGIDWYRFVTEVIVVHAIEIPLFERLMVTSGRSAEELERDLRLLLAVKLFEAGRISLAC